MFSYVRVLHDFPVPGIFRRAKVIEHPGGRDTDASRAVSYGDVDADAELEYSDGASGFPNFTLHFLIKVILRYRARKTS